MKRIAFFLIIIVAIASFFRLWDIAGAPPGLYPDEAMNGNNALEALETGLLVGGFKVFYPENNGREGLFINIQAISVWLFGNKPWAVRLPSTIFGILTVLGVFFLAKELSAAQNQISNIKYQNDRFKFKISHNEQSALLASFLLATSFWHINFSRIGFRAIMAPFFVVWTFYFLWRLFKNNISNGSKIYSAVIGGLFFGLGFYSYLAYRIMPVLLIIPLLKGWRLPKFKNYFLIFIITAFIITLPLGIYFLKNPQDFFGRTTQVSVAASASPIKDLGVNILKTFGMFWFKGDSNWRHNFSGEPQLWWPVGILFLLGIIIIVTAIVKSQITKHKLQTNPKSQSTNYKQTSEYLFLLLWIFLALLPVIVSNEGIPHALRSILVIPPVMIISAVGLEWLISKTKSRLFQQKEKWLQYQGQISRIEKGLVILLFVFLAAIAINSYNQYFLRWAPNPNVYYAFNQNYAELGEKLNTAARELPKYVIINAGGVLALGLPMPSQTVMFITKTYLPEWQKEKNIHYIFPEELDKIDCPDSCAIAVLEKNAELKTILKEKFKNAEIF